jgi:APA family basic amino acid/polyamine antiporter
MGEVLAWIIGWDLILEYGVSVAAVAVGWGAYFVELLDSLFGITLSDSITLPPGEGGDVNIPALLLVLAVASLLIAGIRQSARSNTVMVVTKLLVRSSSSWSRSAPLTATTSPTLRRTASAGSRRRPP